MKKLNLITCALLSLAITGCNDKSQTEQLTAPGAPGVTPYWAYAGKTGIGTSYEQYTGGQYSDQGASGEISKVWFSIAKGMITETMFGLIHQAQLKDMQFVVTGPGFVVSEDEGLESEIDYLHKDADGRPLSLAYKITSRDPKGRFTLEKHVFTDPDGQTLFVRAKVESALDGVKAFVAVNPYVDNNGVGDSARVSGDALVAWQGENYISVQAAGGFNAKTVGFYGSSDGITDLKDNGKLDALYQSTGIETGNVHLLGELGEVNKNATFDVVVSKGRDENASIAEGKQSLARGYAKVLADFNGEGEALGWEDYIASLKALPAMTPHTADGGKLLYTSALVLKAQEDKTHAGALIASLSNPWGDTVKAVEGHTGYKAVWGRDFYQVAMAFMAMGDHATAKTAFEYLEKVQVKPTTPGNQGDSGWFLQKTHVDGELEWVGVQLDQTAMPVMLAWKLWQAKQLDAQELKSWYTRMLKPAADFLVDGGKAKIMWNDTQITPPATQQERWEEQPGFSPSTTAAVIAGLVTAADIANACGDEKNAARYLDTAKAYNERVEALMYTTDGVLKDDVADGRYFFRIGQDTDPNSRSTLNSNNGREGLTKSAVLDGGFLELVRYGVRSADAPSVVSTLPEYDDQGLEENLRVKYEFTFQGETGSYPGWRRYGNDGYGEDEVSGANYGESGQNSSGQRGRVWPFFTGERGHYEIAAATQSENGMSDATRSQLKNTYVKAMELFANEGMMLPEQVWDGVGVNTKEYVTGEGTNSATPLAWTHAEYVKLVRSLTDKAVWDHYPVVGEKLAR